MLKPKILTLILIFSYYSLISQNTKIMCYNILNFPGNTPGRADTLKKIIDHTTPDIFVVNELINQQGANLILNNALNTNGSSEYVSANFVNGHDSDNLLFYKSNKLTLVYQEQIPTNLRDISYYRLYLNNSLNNDTAWFNIFSCHLKASYGASEELLRYEEAQILKNYLDNNNIISDLYVMGDFNFYSNFEDAYYEITTGGNTTLFDPINQEGLWHINYNFRHIHTQSTRGATTGLGGGASGGFDDRFDFIFVSQDVLDGSNNIKYIEDSYRAVGQDGEHYNSSINDGLNTVVSEEVSSALFYMSDHLPVMLEVENANYNSITANTNNEGCRFTNTSNEIFIENLTTSKTIKYNIFSSDGKLIHKGMSYSNTLNKVIPQINTGLYYCKIQLGNLIINKTFFVD